MERKISVIIPVYNNEATLKTCLDSVFSLDYGNYEVIVVDDGSSDRSAGIAGGYPCRIIRLPENLGAGSARDRGVKAAAGDIAAFIDGDCAVRKDWLRKINEGMTVDVIGISGRYDLAKNKDILSRIFLSIWDPMNILYKKRGKIIFCQGGNCAFWRSILMKDRPKKELLIFRKIAGGEDTVMCSELNKYGKILYDPEISVSHDKICSAADIFKKSVKAGYTGIAVSAVCGGLLMKEPYRVYKLASYISALTLFFVLPLYGILPLPVIYFTAACYMIIHTPVAIEARRQLSTGVFTIFYPIAVFLVNLAYFLGQIKRIAELFSNFLKTGAWHIKFMINIIHPGRPSRLFYFVTKKCNANCKFCFNKNSWQISAGDGDMELGEVSALTKRTGFLPFLTVTGGEPFLREDIYEVCREFYLNCSTKFITIVTNGTRCDYISDVTERLLINCPDIRLTVLVALDDINEKHDSIKGIKGCYQKASITLNKLKGLKLKFQNLTVGINTMLIEENSGSIEDILDNFGSSFQYDRQSLNLLREPACTSNEPGFIKLEEYFGMISKANERFFRTDPVFRGRMNEIFMRYCCEKTLKEFKLKKGACSAARKFFVIGNSGDIFPCELLAGPLGNIREEGYDINRLFYGERARKARADIRHKHCYCQWPCAVTNNALFDIGTYIDIFRGVILGGMRDRLRS
ncbi:MAG: glycosyltransferase [Candidatus Omnitrophota bacterium]|jgi:glycosyltransferase involved in cell wall biosynthesis